MEKEENLDEESKEEGSLDAETKKEEIPANERASEDGVNAIGPEAEDVASLD
jgi:hypothetical protein